MSCLIILTLKPQARIARNSLLLVKYFFNSFVLNLRFENEANEAADLNNNK